MNILIVSHVMLPSVGGIERATDFMARGFADSGHGVVVLTSTKVDDTTLDSGLPYRVIRNPSMRAAVGAYHAADVVFHHTMSLRLAWPHLLVRRPYLVVVHIWLQPERGIRRAIGWTKRLALRHAARLIAVSPNIAASLPGPSTVIGNSYDSSVFYELRDVERQDRSIAFVGRLEEDKGVADVIAAVRELRRRGQAVTLRIAGAGPYETIARGLVRDHGLAQYVSFLGVVTGAELNTLLNSTVALVIPSRWEEPFGIVALEGFAAGCSVIGTDAGALPWVIGDAGLLVTPRDVPALADAIERTLSDRVLRSQLQQRAQLRLIEFSADRVMGSYHDVLTAIVASRPVSAE